MVQNLTGQGMVKCMYNRYENWKKKAIIIFNSVLRTTGELAKCAAARVSLCVCIE